MRERTFIGLYFDTDRDNKMEERRKPNAVISLLWKDYEETAQKLLAIWWIITESALLLTDEPFQSERRRAFKLKSR